MAGLYYTLEISGGDEMDDRRVFARIRVKIPVKLVNPANGKEAEGETLDISANGVGLVTKENIPAHTPLEMWLEIPDHHEPLHVVGQVIWSHDVSDTEYKRIGVLLEEEKLVGLARALMFKAPE